VNSKVIMKDAGGPPPPDNDPPMEALVQTDDKFLFSWRNHYCARFPHQACSYPTWGEYSAGAQAIEHEPWFPGWNCIPFGGWNLYILKMVLACREAVRAENRGQAEWRSPNTHPVAMCGSRR
jgi:hypothetical protein